MKLKQIIREDNRRKKPIKKTKPIAEGGLETLAMVKIGLLLGYKIFDAIRYFIQTTGSEVNTPLTKEELKRIVNNGERAAFKDMAVNKNYDKRWFWERDKDDARLMRRDLHAEIDAGRVKTIADLVRAMRRIDAINAALGKALNDMAKRL